jgi:nitrile hydratase
MKLPDDRPPRLSVTPALGETPVFQPGQQVRVTERFPLGHYRVPLYLRGKSGVVERLVQPAIDNEEEGFGLNAGQKRHYYRIGVAMSDIWTDYTGAKQDRLYIEVFETWLEAADHA